MRNLMTAALVSAAFVPLASAAQADTTLNWALWDWSATVYYQPLIDAYQAKHPDVKITYTDLGSGQYDQMLMTQLTGGATDLDIITIKDMPGYAQLITSNNLLDLKKQGVDVSPDGYGGTIQAMTVDGGLYALPFRSDFWLVYYNKDLFDAAGVTYPTNDMTWAQFDDTARKLTSGFGANKVYGTYLHTWRSPVEMPGIQDGKHTVADGTYEWLKPWYERALKLQDDGIVPTYASLKTSNTHYSGPFYNQQIATLPMGSWFIGTQIAKVASGESLAKHWGIVKFPHPEGVPAGNTAAVVTALGVSANSKNKDAAIDFVKFVSGPEGAAVVAKTGTIPALKNKDVVATITSKPGFPDDPASAEALQVNNAYLEMPVTPKAGDIELVLNRAHDDIMTENTSIDDGIAEMDKGVKEILK